MNNTDFVNKAINSRCKISNCLKIIQNTDIKTLVLTTLLLLNCNLAIAQEQSKPDTTSHNTIDAKNDSSYTVNGKKIVEGKGIETTVKYESKDSIVYDMENKLIHLYGDAKVDYGTRALNSDKIIIDYTKNTVTSIGGTDSIGKTKGRPVFKEGSETYVADKIVFNFETKKGVVYGAETQQGEGFISGEAIKKNGDEELFVKGATYTTCDRKHPHFGFKAHKIKIITNKKILSGPGQLEVGGTPMPIFIPFGFFPYPKKRSSGLLMPSLAGAASSGNYLRSLGVYLAINDYLGLKVLGDIFFNGGYRASTDLDYRVNYRFSGNFSYSRNSLVSGFGETKLQQPITNNVTWNHNQLAKRRGRFSARVNISSSEYNRQNASQITQYAQQDFNSSINYSRSFPKTGISLNLTSSYTNNSVQKTAQAQLPTVNFGLPNGKPFKNVGKSGKLPLLQNINVSPSFEFKNVIYNKISSYDTSITNGEYYRYNFANVHRSIDSIKLNKDLNFQDLARHSSYGARWAVSIFTDAKVLKYINLRPNFNITGNVYDKSLVFAEPYRDSLYYQIQKGLYTPFSYNFGVTASTMIYGMVRPKIWGLKAIRHVMTPSVSYSLQPKVNKGSAYYNYMFQENPLNPKADLPRAGGMNNEFIYGAPSVSAYSEVISFSVLSSIEAKVRDRKDSSDTGKDKKIKLIENLTFNGNYNLSADSFKLSNINVSAVTRLFNKISINGNVTLDPYKYYILEKDGVYSYKRIDSYLFNDLFNGGKDPAFDAMPYNVDSYSIKNNNYLADIRSVSFNMSTSINPNWKMKNSYTPQEEALFRIYPYLRYVDFSLPWNASISYQFNDSRPVWGPATTSKTVNVSGNLTILESWKVNYSTSYDLKTFKWGGHQLGIIKDLHCWQILFNWTPSNAYATYTFKLSAKASTLKGFEPIQKNGTSAF